MCHAANDTVRASRIASCRPTSPPSDTNFSYTAWLRPGLEERPAFLVVSDGHAEL
jgi:hypothetical protein